MQRKLLAAAVGILAALVLGEMLVRVLGIGIGFGFGEDGGMRALHELRPEKPWLYGMRPSTSATLTEPAEATYRVNADGFRDRDVAHEKPPATFRIALLGDSVSFGYGVALEDTFAKQLETKLAGASRASDRSDRSYEVLNLGVSGYNPYTEAALLEDVGLAYAPDLVLAQFCMNDLNDPSIHFDFSTALALGEIPEEAYPDPSVRRAPPSGARELCARSRLCNAIAEATGWGEPDLATKLAGIAPHHDPSPTELAWLDRHYAKMAQLAAARGAKFALVVFPDMFQLEPRASHGVQERLRALGEERGFPVIDLLPAFLAAKSAAEEPLFFDPWHPTPRGHRLAADALYRDLACERLVPGLPCSR